LIFLFFIRDRATTGFYSLSLHDRSSDLGLLAAGGAYRQVAVQPPAPGGVVRCSDGSELAGDAYVFACGPWLGKLFPDVIGDRVRSEEHTSELQSRSDLVCRPPLAKKN